MQKLVYVHSWGDEGCCGTSHIPFLYSSKEDFVFDILERFKDFKWISNWHEEEIKELGVSLSKFELENIEYSVTTLEEWFETNKINKNV